MRLLLVTPYFPPQTAIASRRVHAHAMAWSKAGHEVTVLTTAKRDDQRGLDLACDGIELVEIAFRAPRVLERFRGAYKMEPVAGNHDRHGQGGSGIFGVLRRMRDRAGVFGSVRMPDLTDYWVKPAVAWCQTLSNQKWDAVISSSGPYTAHLVAMQIKRRGLAKSWAAEFRDLWTQNHIFPGVFPFTLRERMLEAQCLRQADLLVTVAEILADQLGRRAGRNVALIYNGFDADALGALPGQPIFPRDGRFRIVFTGTLYTRRQGLDPRPLLRALAALRTTHPEIALRLRLVVAGQGGEMWAKLAREFDLLDLIDVRGLVSGTDALRMQRDADALLLLDNTDPRKGALSGKVFEYLHASAPILLVGGGVRSPMGELVEKARRGVNLACDQQRIEQALITWMTAGEASTMEHRGDREFISQFSRTRQSMRLLEHLEALRRA